MDRHDGQPGETDRAADQQHYAAGRFADAERCLRLFMQQHPDDAGAACDLGNALLAQDQTEAGVDWFRTAVRLSPAFAGGHINLGVGLLKLHRFHEADESLARALALEPDNPIACLNRGVARHTAGQHDEAVTWLAKAQALRPQHPETANELGKALQAAGKLDEAVESYRQALALRPGFLAAARNLGSALQAGKRFGEAAEVFQIALDLAPGGADLWNDLGSAQVGAGDPIGALASYRQALAIQPGLAAAHANMALSLSSLDRVDEGIDACRRAIAIEAGAPVPHMSLGCLMLTQGRFRQGWEGYEYRFAMGGKGWIRNEANAAPWMGEPLRGRSILILGEQGNGDHLQFVRYLPELADMGAAVSFLLPARLCRLFSTLRGRITLLETLPAQCRFDYQWPLMSLPLRFEELGLGLPAQVPYLAAEPGRVAAWRDVIGDAGLRVAVAWQGNRYGTVDFGRSYPLAELHPLAQVPGVRLISLQIGEGVEQQADLPPGMAVESLGPAFDAGDHAFLDAAAVMRVVDLVITSDTALAHLAGALGCPVWLALNSAPEWRWQRGRSDSPWYPTARLFRQSIAGDWGSVFRQMVPELARLADAARGSQARAATRPMPAVPVSWGEVFDKASILEIKAQRMEGATALANVARELDCLRAVLGQLGEDLAQVRSDREALHATNVRLWDLEDEIRSCEANHRFDARFVEVARLIYIVNDERGRLKRAINAALDSELVEEKQYQLYAPAGASAALY